jgi:hypothetical protein
VLHHAEACHPGAIAQLGERLAVALEQPVEERAARWIGECLEDEFHEADNM